MKEKVGVHRQTVNRVTDTTAAAAGTKGRRDARD